MKKPMNTARRIRLRTLALVAAIALPATSGGPALADEGAVNASAQEPEFANTFAALPSPTRNFDTPAGAVDITEIEIPVEAEPEPALRTLGTGISSFYGKRFAGRLTANGERFNPSQLTAAHKTLPFGTIVQVTNPRNGKSVTVRINDRGPYAHGRSIDLSRAAAKMIGLVQRGHGKVEMAILES
jgi:rare lipoprotein A